MPVIALEFNVASIRAPMLFSLEVHTFATHQIVLMSISAPIFTPMSLSRRKSIVPSVLVRMALDSLAPMASSPGIDNVAAMMGLKH
jgi:hypothetical protein